VSRVGRATPIPPAAEGVVTGRICREQIWIRTDHGATVMIRVGPELGARLDLAQRVVIEFDSEGNPASARPFEEDPQRQAHSLAAESPPVP
jgi:hypothetical protein